MPIGILPRPIGILGYTPLIRPTSGWPQHREDGTRYTAQSAELRRSRARSGKRRRRRRTGGRSR